MANQIEIEGDEGEFQREKFKGLYRKSATKCWAI
jgi:hypothetical protein